MDPEDAAPKANVETLDDKIQAGEESAGPEPIMELCIYIYRERERE